MLKHVRLNASEVLPQTPLTDLGHINVVCGKNNSGKTTVLNAVATKDQHSVGVFVGDDLLQNVAMAYTENTKFRSGDALNQWGDALVHEFRLIDKRVWWASEHEEFSSALRTRHQSNQFTRQFAFDTARINGIFNSLFPVPQRAVLLPAKRQVDLTTDMLKKDVSVSGYGLLNHLFRLLNQEEGTSGRQQVEQIQELFTSISSGFEFRMVLNAEHRLNLRFKSPTGAFADAANCGLGLQDLLVILYFATSDQSDIVLIEEPESHLHPEMQRKLLAFLAKNSSKQFFLATHSNVFLDTTFVDKVLYTTIRDRKIHVSDETSKATILSDLGYEVTDNLVSDLIVLVEGPKDVPVFEHFLAEMDVIPKKVVKFWPLGGDIMDQLDLSVFVQSHKLIAVVDKDPGSRRIRDKFKQKCGEAKIRVLQLERYATENYFTLAALRAVFKSQIPSAVTDIKPNKKLQEQIGIDVKANNGRIVKRMKLSDIETTDLYDILKEISLQANA